MAIHDEVKAIEKRLTVLKVKIQEAQDGLAIKQREKSDLLAQQKKLQADLERLKNSRIDVSDHAVLRYLERAGLVDVQKIKEMILSPKNVKMIETLGDCNIPIEPDLKLVVKGNKVVTVLEMK